MSFNPHASPAVFILPALTFILFRLGYHCLGLPLCRRPLAAGICFWFLTRDYNLLLAALFFELFWLDLFHTGTYVPPDALFAYLVFTPLTLYFSLNGPPAFTFALLASLPLSPASARLEQIWRRRQGIYYHRLNAAIDQGGDIEGVMRSILRQGLIWNSALGLLFYAAASFGLWLFLTICIELFGNACAMPWSNWKLLLCLAALGGLLALRIAPALTCFGVGGIILGIIAML